jgi:hypothetical protein
MSTILIINAISSLTAGGVVGGWALRARKRRQRERVDVRVIPVERRDERSSR